MLYLEILLFIIIMTTMLSFISLAPWVPTKKKDLIRINKILKLKKWEKFLEMWCWTAKVCLYIAKNNPDSQIIWIELSPLFYTISKIKIFLSRTKNINIIYGNALKLNLENYNIIYIFGLPETITKKVFPKISKIKNKNFRLISYCFKMTNDYFKETKHKTENRFAIYEYKSSI